MAGYRVQGRARNRPKEGDSAGWRDLEWLRVCGSPRMGGTRDGGMYRKGCSRGSERTSGTRDIGLSSKGRVLGKEREPAARGVAGSPVRGMLVLGREREIPRDVGISSTGRARSWNAYGGRMKAGSRVGECPWKSDDGRQAILRDL